MRVLAVEHRSVRVCDRCRRDDEVSRYRLLLLVSGGRHKQVTFDACEECREVAPLSFWAELMNRPRGVKASPVVEDETAIARHRRKPRKRS